jgi:hypothetical protein
MSTNLEIKIDKRFLINFILIAAVVLAVLEFAELAVIAYSLKTGALCK